MSNSGFTTNRPVIPSLLNDNRAAILNQESKPNAHQHKDSGSHAREISSCLTETGVDELSEPGGLVKESRRKQFRHKPLNLNSASIRIIKVLPATPSDDNIRCTVRHSSVYATYTCVSYVWGSADEEHPILIDGKIFYVRKNLWDFLKVAQSSLMKRMDHEATDETVAPTFDLEMVTPYLWVDALCIDQENTSERNHQVQQMGRIFKNAQCVIAWLGNRPHHQTGSNSVLALELDGTTLETICENNYWKRAWITQELILAHNIYFLANKEATDLASFVPSLERHRLRWTRGHQLQTQVLDILTERNDRCTIFENLWRFRQKMCSNLRDRVYSLLAISQNGDQLKVNYDQPILDLALEILISLREELCICHAKMVFEALLSVSDFRGRYEHSPFVKLTLPAARRCRVDNQDICSYCGDWVDEIHPGEQSGTRYYYCLGCYHHSSRVQAAPPTMHRNGHISIARGEFRERGLRGYGQLTMWESWHLSWMRPYMTKRYSSSIHETWTDTGSEADTKRSWTDVNVGVNIISMDETGDLVIDISLPTFFEWASVPLKARFCRTNDCRVATYSLRNSLPNLKWELIPGFKLERKRTSTTLRQLFRSHIQGTA